MHGVHTLMEACDFVFPLPFAKSCIVSFKGLILIDVSFAGVTCMIGMFHCECQYLQRAFFGHLKKLSKIDYPVSDDRGLLACLQGVNLHTA